MKSNYSSFDFEKSKKRIDEILDSSDNSYEEVKAIPSRDKLSYTNGFYTYCTALFVDIRKSSELSDKHKRPTLAKIYRSYISEVVAVINGNINCVEVNIHGDSVWGVFNTEVTWQIDTVFSTAAEISSIIDTLNCKLEKKNITPLTVGIGMDYGRALMIKAGYNGSGINDVVWMGEVVNRASKLCSYGNRNLNDRELMVSSVVYQNLNDHNKSLLTYHSFRDCYHGYIVNTGMNEWINNNCK